MPIKSTERHTFTIPIGDWSDDGHGKCESYRASATKRIEAVREAWFVAKKKLPEAIHPDVFCKRFGQRSLTAEQVEALAQAKALVFEEPEWVTADEMAAVVVWFLNQGDPDLDVRLEKAEPSLVFSGFDAYKRHIGHIGYGLFS